MNISQKLNKWQSAGLISKEQATQIINYETKNTKPYLMYALVFLSIFFIGSGVISLIAANWDVIPYFVKLTLDFLLLGACGCGVYYTQNKDKKIYFEALLFLFALLSLATIGLIAQIYQLQSDGPVAFLLWSVLMLPLSLFSKKIIFPLIVLSTFFGSSLYYLGDFIYYIFRVWVAGGYLMLLLAFMLIYQSLKLFLPNKTIGFCNALKFCIIYFLIIGTYYADFGIYSFNDVNYASHSHEFTALLFIVLFLLGASYFLEFLNKRNFILSIIASIITIGTIVPLGFIANISVLSVLVYYAYNQKQIKLLNFAVFMIGVRVFILYSEIFINLMTTGFGFIVSGIVLLLLVLGWKRVSKYFQRRLKNEN